MVTSIVNKETKKFNLSLLLPCKSSWDFSQKNEYNKIINLWKMTFQASDNKGRNFLELLDDNLNIIEPSYSKGGLWLKFFGHSNSNSLCARAMRAIVNHAPIGEYQLRFFPREDFTCPCGLYLIKTRRHILHECKRYNNYWNPRRDTLAHFILFLEFNSSVFSFGERITWLIQNVVFCISFPVFLSFLLLFCFISLFFLSYLHVVSFWMYITT